MDRIFVSIGKLRCWLAKSSGFCRFRLVAQLIEYHENEGQDNPGSIKCKLGELAELTSPVELSPSALSSVSDGQDNHFIWMVMGEKLVFRKFVQNASKKPVEGDVLDMKCYVCEDQLEILDFELVTIRELAVLNSFWRGRDNA
ncbi:LAMI_0H09538g1_1 [Lachancea mirantina]|uniref:LAMI_0H09538g1_1 n=1 Tax=Lachancea mirantina TaxID=1230905 RepID=A0A1G4KGD9_9SACH|nr:LAMI_0H09538g1_1 [Lachancea mirantina]